MIKGKVFLTGGSGTLGKAIIRRGHEENWPCEFTVFSRDPVKQFPIKKEYPNVRFLLGDITDFGLLKGAIAGHDVVLHLAAQKHIPTGEFNVMQTIQVNLQGSINVAEACFQNMVKKVVAISTDKVVHPVNTYGATKYLMEKVFQEYAFLSPETTKFTAVRYGNVLGSTGSVIQVWRNMVEESGKVHATDPDMTRFWLTVDQAVNLVLLALEDGIPTGSIVIPICESTSMKELASYVIADYIPIEYTGIRPGEKRYEELLGKEESLYAQKNHANDFILLRPTTTPVVSEEWEFNSTDCPRFTEEEILSMIGE